MSHHAIEIQFSLLVQFQVFWKIHLEFRAAVHGAFKSLGRERKHQGVKFQFLVQLTHAYHCHGAAASGCLLRLIDNSRYTNRLKAVIYADTAGQFHDLLYRVSRRIDRVCRTHVQRHF